MEAAQRANLPADMITEVGLAAPELAVRAQEWAAAEASAA